MLFVGSSCASMLPGNNVKLLRVQQSLSNLREGQFSFKCLFWSGVKSVFKPGAPGELLEDLTLA